MNFEFIQNLDVLNHAYDSCKNAEDLAKSKPDLSMIAARKSAEVIAKSVYLIAHSEMLDDLTFADILSDYTVRNYLRNRDVLDAFHFVRKHGNAAVHTLTQESPDEAIAVLEKLHYAVGETAKRMKLIAKYPPFNPGIADNPFATLLETSETGNIAQEIYNDYVISQNRVQMFLDEFTDLVGPIITISGDEDQNETLIFDHKPLLKTTITKIQEHFSLLALKAARYLNEENPERELHFSGKITLFGKDGYTATDLYGFMHALMYDLPNADGFKITTTYYGPSIAPWNDHEVQEFFSKTVEKLGEQEQFTYTSFYFLYNHGEGDFIKYKNGKWLDTGANFTESIVDQDFGKDWWCWNQDLAVEFDFDAYPDILEALHDAVRKHIPRDQIEYCEGTWEDGEVGILCSSIFWTPRKLRVIQDFLDEINRILQPIVSECTGYADGNWYITEEPYAIATWDWTTEGFKITGTAL